MGRIIVGVDGSHLADRALRWAVREAELRSAPIELLMGFVVHPYTAMFGGTDRDLAQSRLDQTAERNQALLARVKWSSTLVEAGSAPEALLDAASDAELVVVGARGAGGFQQLVVGSTSYRVAAHAPVPVAVIPDGDPDQDGGRAITVGIDDSPPARNALEWALAEAARRAVGLVVIHSYLLPVSMSASGVLNQELYERAHRQAHDDATALLDEVVDAAAVPDDVTVERVVVVGTPADALLQTVGERLLVVGTRGHRTFGRMSFGSVSQQVLHHAKMPVVVVP